MYTYLGQFFDSSFQSISVSSATPRLAILKRNQKNITICMMITVKHFLFIRSSFLSPPFAKAGDIKTHSSVRPSVRLSVTKTLTWLISSEVFMIEHWYLACMILVTSPFNWHHVVTLNYFKVKVVAGRGTTILRISLSRKFTRAESHKNKILAKFFYVNIIEQEKANHKI